MISETPFLSKSGVFSFSMGLQKAASPIVLAGEGFGTEAKALCRNPKRAVAQQRLRDYISHPQYKPIVGWIIRQRQRLLWD